MSPGKPQPAGLRHTCGVVPGAAIPANDARLDANQRRRACRITAGNHVNSPDNATET